MSEVIMYKFKTSKRHLLIAGAIGVAIGLVIGIYSIQPKPKPKQQVESIGYFDKEGNFHAD
jgi:hypothetical protein